jgi:hypothetical protein
MGVIIPSLKRCLVVGGKPLTDHYQPTVPFATNSFARLAKIMDSSPNM